MIEINWFLTDRNKLVLFLEDGSENTYLAIFTMLIIGRDIYGEGELVNFRLEEFLRCPQASFCARNEQPSRESIFKTKIKSVNQTIRHPSEIHSA
jgi:hypothetical protein